MPPKPDKPNMDKPKPPPSSASKEEHQRYAEVVLEDPEYKRKPEGYEDKNDVVRDYEEGILG